MDMEESEVILHRLTRRGTAAANGTLLTAKGVLRGSRVPVSPSRHELVTRRPVGLMVGLLTFGSSRIGGRDATRRTEAMYPCTTGQHKAPGYLAPARVSRPAGSRHAW